MPGPVHGTSPLTPGTRLGSYEILGLLGAGGMGEVHRARDDRLGREVALKILPPALGEDPHARERLEREARTASALNHPNIVTIHDIGDRGGKTYIAMELVDGHDLRRLIAEGPVDVDRVLELALQVTEGLAKAHAAGIVHRDIKPANVMVTGDGLVKILDFGLARPSAAADAVEPSAVPGPESGLYGGTPRHMAPEQWSGEGVDHRADQFACGILLYEMLAGAVPFDGPSVHAVMTATLTGEPTPLRRLRPDVPAELDRIVARCLAKDPEDRFASIAELAESLRALRDRRLRARHGLRALVRKPAVAIPLAALVAAAATGAGVYVAGADRRWAETEAIPEIEALVAEGDLYGAFRTGRRAAALLGDDPGLARVMDRFTLPAQVTSDPPGAGVRVRRYGEPDAPWLHLGATPLTTRIPYAVVHWRIEKEGYEPFEGAPFSGTSIQGLAAGVVLERAGDRPPAMVRVPGGAMRGFQGPTAPAENRQVRLEAYHLDRYEVTNAAFGDFVDAGGYGRPEWWPAMRRGDRDVPWDRAVAGFVDATGRPGPAAWRDGTYPAGEADHPVRGISWYEAAAYCDFAGKSLPTTYHWVYAIGQDQVSDILLHSNISGVSDGVAPVGRYPGLAAYGTYDMAGNVSEWTWNATGDLRYLMGAAWNEPGYLFRQLIGHDPWTRPAAAGVRCARYDAPLPERLLTPVVAARRYTRPAPLDDETFRLVRGLYAYDRGPLEARVEAVDDSSYGYRRETVSFRTAYGDGRMAAHLLIPRDAEPPYQSVIWFPGDDVYTLRSSERISSSFLVDFLPRAGRVLVQPVLYGMYERFQPPPRTPLARRDALIRWAQDIGRTIDYLETRSDFDARRIGFYGFSGGAVLGPVLTAVEPRLATAILLGGGSVVDEHRPEADPALFAPRSSTPTLMINGRDDFLMPLDAAQRPFFDALGAPEDRKRHAVLAGGHIPDRAEIEREVVAWLDRELGPLPR